MTWSILIFRAWCDIIKWKKRMKTTCIYFAIGWFAIKSVTSLIAKNLSASESGISMTNSSSQAMTTSTASRESKSRSSLKRAVAETFPLLTFVLMCCWNDRNLTKVSRISRQSINVGIRKRVWSYLLEVFDNFYDSITNHFGVEKSLFWRLVKEVRLSNMSAAYTW